MKALFLSPSFLIKLTVFGYLLCFGLLPAGVMAASLAVSPSTGVYSTGSTFTVNVLVNTSGAAINAADGTLSFNPRELSVVSVSRGTSIFNLWTAEPSFSNSAGTISFSGGSPSGYTGSSGVVMSATFRSLTSGTARVSMTGGSVLAADGRGTNVLTNMGGGTYTLSAVESQPAPEVIIEYVPPANTPAAPQIKSTTHSDPDAWYQTKDASLSWALPAGVTAVRTLLDKSPTAIPTKVYDNPISSITLSDLDEGVSYFHIQFKNGDGWGRVANYRLAVDFVKPESFTISLPDNADLASPKQVLKLVTGDNETSPVRRFKVQIDGGEPSEFIDTEDKGELNLPELTPGYHTAVIEAFDAAGNSSIATFSFTISAFDKPVITDYPAELNEGVIPVIKGSTRPLSSVEVTLTAVGAEPRTYTVAADDKGVFVFIPDGAFSSGVYTLTAVATDQYGAKSEVSDTVRIAVQKPGYILIGSYLVSILSVIIPLLALLALTWLMIWYGATRWRKLRAKVLLEAGEAVAILHKEFDIIDALLMKQEDLLRSSRKTKKLTQAEETLLAEVKSALSGAKVRVEKEVTDVTKVVSKKQ